MLRAAGTEYNCGAEATVSDASEAGSEAADVSLNSMVWSIRSSAAKVWVGLPRWVFMRTPVQCLAASWTVYQAAAPEVLHMQKCHVSGNAGKNQMAKCGPTRRDYVALFPQHLVETCVQHFANCKCKCLYFGILLLSYKADLSSATKVRRGCEPPDVSIQTPVQ